ncbi:hypothetical protein F5Y16DRAFT_404763 [Xylariaceae sp. FL0255]|nr:hypothetical protein F5Y16DRAFT_404763 [Xylariaceae sp. FL0255]
MRVTLFPFNDRKPDMTFEDDVDVIREAISLEVNVSTDVVAIAVREDTAANEASHVTSLLLIASDLSYGPRLYETLPRASAPTWRVNRDTGYAEIVMSPREMFYHGLPKDEADYWVSQLTTQGLQSLFESGEFSYTG